MSKKWIFCVFATLLLLNCRGQERVDRESAFGDEPFELAVYTAPSGMQQSLSEILNRSFSAVGGKDGRRVARIEVLPNGQLALLGPARVHQGMAKVIDSLGKAAAPPAENASLSLWIVLAAPSEKKTTSPGLTEITDVIQDLALAEQMTLHLLEKIKVTAAVGAHSRNNGNFFSMEYGLFKIGDRNVAELQIRGEDGPHNQLDTRVYFKSGQTMVLGESRYLLRSAVAEILDMEPGNYTLLYILKAEDI